MLHSVRCSSPHRCYRVGASVRFPSASEGAVVGPVKGTNGVYVYQVYGVDNESRPYSYEENAARYSQQLGAQAVLGNVIGILMNNNPAENNTPQVLH